jgi:hypothetical protein
MTAFDYARSQATALRLITRFGQVGAIRRTAAATGTPHAPIKGAATDHAAKFAVIDFRASEIDGTRILATDKKALLSASGLAVTPALSDLLVDAAGSAYKIVNIETVSPAGTVVMYTLQVRR